MNVAAVSSGLGLTLYIELRQPGDGDALSTSLTVDKVVTAYFGHWPEERLADLSATLKTLVRRRDASLKTLQTACATALATNKARYQ